MRSVGLSLLFLLSLSVLFLSCRPELTIMSYNVDNLFDDVDSGTEYEEYDPGGGRWTNEDFTDKLKAVAEVIKRAHPRGPDIVALQEVENRLCLDRLCDDHLSNLDYRYRVLVPARDQAVHCAFISRYPITRVGALNPGYWEGRAQRMIVEAVIAVEGHSLHVFNNHWKSKIGGNRATEPARLAASRLLAERIGEILAEEPQADIVVLGDFNENVGEYEEYGGAYPTALMPLEAGSGEGQAEEADAGESKDSLWLTADAGKTGDDGVRIVLYEPWYGVGKETWGSYVYQGRWQTPDHVLLSAGLFDRKGFFYQEGSFRVLRFSFLLDEKTGFPKRRNSKWTYSDHLPILASLGITSAAAGETGGAVQGN